MMVGLIIRHQAASQLSVYEVKLNWGCLKVFDNVRNPLILDAIEAENWKSSGLGYGWISHMNGKISEECCLNWQVEENLTITNLDIGEGRLVMLEPS